MNNLSRPIRDYCEKSTDILTYFVRAEKAQLLN